MPSLLPRRGVRHAAPHRALLHVAPQHAPRRSGMRRLRLALLAAPLLAITGAVVAAPSLAPAIAPTATPDAFAGPITITPRPTQPAVTAQPTPTSLPTSTPTPRPSGPTSKPPEELKGFTWPLRNARLTSRFGQRDDGGMIVNGERYHDGIDLATWCGDKVRAAHSGTVLYAGRKFDEYMGYSGPLDAFYARMEQIGGVGRWLPIVVVIDYGNGYRGAYAHLSKATVEAGDVVAAGQVIGLEGATGRATGCHLHYALIRMDGAWLSVEPSYVAKLRYPEFVRERVDPLLVLPRTHVYAPLKLQLRNRIPVERIPFTLQRD